LDWKHTVRLTGHERDGSETMIEKLWEHDFRKTLDRVGRELPSVEQLLRSKS
jgi:hypothetical protein